MWSGQSRGLDSVVPWCHPVSPTDVPSGLRLGSLLLTSCSLAHCAQSRTTPSPLPGFLPTWPRPPLAAPPLLAGLWVWPSVWQGSLSPMVTGHLGAQQMPSDWCSKTVSTRTRDKVWTAQLSPQAQGPPLPYHGPSWCYRRKQRGSWAH
jgi:hypothetical protein